MIRKITDAANLVSGLCRKVRRDYPNEKVKLVTAVTILKTKGELPVGWSLARFFQKRGNLVVTSKRIVVRTNFFSPISLLMLGFLGFFCWQAYRTGYHVIAIPGLFTLPYLLQRLPFSADLLLSDINKINFGTVQGTIKCDILAVVLPDYTINLVTSKRISEDLRDQLEASANRSN